MAEPCRSHVINAVIQRLERIKHWFTEQRTFAFYASSLLIVYDGDAAKPGPDSDADGYNIKSGLDTDVNASSNSYCMNGCSQTLPDDSSTRDCGHCLCSTGSDVTACLQQPIIDIRMIDFTHSIRTTEEDGNYLFGLQSLIRHLNSLLELET
jgi:hypothetical protein